MKTAEEKQTLSTMVIETLLSLDDADVEELCNALPCPTRYCKDCPFDNQDSLAASLQYLEVKDVA